LNGIFIEGTHGYLDFFLKVRHFLLLLLHSGELIRVIVSRGRDSPHSRIILVEINQIQK
jgi:hypothetical protein